MTRGRTTKAVVGSRLDSPQMGYRKMVTKKKPRGPRAIEDRKLFEPSPALALIQRQRASPFTGNESHPSSACGARNVSLANHVGPAPPSETPDAPLGQVPPVSHVLPEAAGGRRNKPSVSTVCLSKEGFLSPNMGQRGKWVDFSHPIWDSKIGFPNGNTKRQGAASP